MSMVEGPRLDVVRVAAHDELLHEAVLAGGPIDHRLPYPKHEFRSYLVHGRGLLAHGSNDGEIEEFEVPANEAGTIRPGVYVASDGIWPMCYAPVYRGFGFPVLNSGCALVGTGQLLRRYYHFAISRGATILPRGPRGRSTCCPGPHSAPPSSRSGSARSRSAP
jgi:hypothetical protein